MIPLAIAAVASLIAALLALDRVLSTCPECGAVIRQKVTTFDAEGEVKQVFYQCDHCSFRHYIKE